jgi:hypothetical protein
LGRPNQKQKQQKGGLTNTKKKCRAAVSKMYLQKNKKKLKNCSPKEQQKNKRRTRLSNRSLFYIVAPQTMK